jgi:hypothetical protein
MSALLNLGDKITAGNRADATFFYKKRVADDSGTLLTEAETDANNRELLAQSLFDKASVVYTAGGVKAGTNYSVKGTDFTVTRAGVKNVVNRAGVLTEIPANTPATEFSNGVLKGTLIEPARTNGIRNNTMQGAVVGVVGSGGQRPTNWVGANTAGLSEEIVSSTVIDGIEVLTVRVFGTADATANRTVYFDANAAITASNGQVWTGSLYFQVINEPSPPTNYRSVITERTDAGTFITQESINIPNSSVFSRKSQTRTLSGGGTVARVQFGVDFPVVNGQSYDFTIRIGLPQMEQSAVATSVIKTTTTTITQPADVITATGLGSVLPQTEGTLYAEVEMKSVGSVARSIFDINNGTTGTRASIVATAQLPDTFRIGLNSGGLVQCLFDSPFVGGTIYKIALACKVNDFTSYINGTSIGTDNSGIVPEFTQIGIGNLAGGISQTNGWIRMVALFPTRLTNAELETLTTL